jgi:hypothetical protein
MKAIKSAKRQPEAATRSGKKKNFLQEAKNSVARHESRVAGQKQKTMDS